jgi:hypothetical protein
VLASNSLIAERIREIATPVTQQSQVTEVIAKFIEKIAANGRLNTEDYLQSWSISTNLRAETDLAWLRGCLFSHSGCC